MTVHWVECTVLCKYRHVPKLLVKCKKKKKDLEVSVGSSQEASTQYENIGRGVNKMLDFIN